MTFPTDWDVEKYHVEHESDEHWELRRRFLETHKDKYPEDRLVCLAQVFYNVEFMGCRYPEKTMRLVAQLSDGVADEHREKMKTKLQRTFVQASDAASSKVKGHNRNESTAPSKPRQINFQKSSNEISQIDPTNSKALEENDISKPLPTKSKKKKSKKKKKNSDPSLSNLSSSNDIPGRFVLADQSRFSDLKSNRKRPGDRQESQHLPPKKMTSIEEVSSRLVLMESRGMNPYGILSRSTGASHMTLKQENKKVDSETEVTLSIDGHVLAKARGRGIEEAKKLSAAEALAKLKKSCYTLIVKDRLAGSVVDKSGMSNTEGKNSSQNEVPEHLAEDSKANRMMKLMGWAGGGLGKNQQGREEPVQVVEHVKRAGLGKQEDGGPVFRKNMTDILQKYRRNNAKHDLVFASDFSKDERKYIHNIANKFGLKSVSYGKDADRQLVVSRKKSPIEIVEEVKEAGGSTDKYDLIAPECN